jgi:hypothetical protein
MTIAVIWPLASWYLRPTPESMKLLPDGVPGRPWAPPTKHADDRPARFAAFVSNRRFATLSAGFALGIFAQVGVIAHLISRLVPLMGAINAAAAVSLATASAVIGRVLLGMLGNADRRLERDDMKPSRFLFHGAERL